jgi:hypothetical protein
MQKRARLNKLLVRLCFPSFGKCMRRDKMRTAESVDQIPPISLALERVLGYQSGHSYFQTSCNHGIACRNGSLKRPAS